MSPGGSVITRLKAFRSLRWNYTRKGVWAWLKGRQCFKCGGKGEVVMVVLHFPRGVTGGGHGRNELAACSACDGEPRRGYQRILSEPKTVIAEQTAIAEGVMG